MSERAQSDTRPPSSSPSDHPADNPNVERRLPTEVELRATLTRRTSETGALAAGVRLAIRTAAIGAPVAISYGLVSGLVGYGILQLAIGARGADPAVLELGGRIALGLGGFAAVYGVRQFLRRDRVNRASWWPSLFAVPLLLTGLGLLMVRSEGARQLAPLVLSLLVNAWSLVWMSFGGALTAIIWLRAGKAAAEGRSVPFRQLLDEAFLLAAVRVRRHGRGAPSGNARSPSVRAADDGNPRAAVSDGPRVAAAG